jgi:hypothetical protein
MADHRSMPLDYSEIRSLSEAWIEHQLLSKETVNEATFWAWERLRNLVRCEPEEAWKVIEAIRQANGSDCILGVLAADPLEDLLAEHGDECIDRVETWRAGMSSFASCSEQSGETGFRIRSGRALEPSLDCPFRAGAMSCLTRS